MPALDATQIQQFIEDGFVRLDEAFPRHVADAGRAILWRDTGCDPDDPSTWSRPVIRLGSYFDPPFVEAANTPILHDAFDQLVGRGRWLRPGGLGTFPIRFPSSGDPGDAGWHIDASFGTETSDFMEWRANIRSKGRALLMLFLFSDVGPDDAPTRIRVGSHVGIAKILAPAGDDGLTLRELGERNFGLVGQGREVLATGNAGAVYLCHPFLVHAAQPHRGVRARFLAQPPLLPAEPLSLEREENAYSPVEQAIRNAIHR